MGKFQPDTTLVSCQPDERRLNGFPGGDQRISPHRCKLRILGTVLTGSQPDDLFELAVEMRQIVKSGGIAYFRNTEIVIDEHFACVADLDFVQKLNIGLVRM